jgi:hypothetical protein
LARNSEHSNSLFTFESNKTTTTTTTLMKRKAIVFIIILLIGFTQGGMDINIIGNEGTAWFIRTFDIRAENMLERMYWFINAFERKSDQFLNTTNDGKVLFAEKLDNTLELFNDTAHKMLDTANDSRDLFAEKLDNALELFNTTAYAFLKAIDSTSSHNVKVGIESVEGMFRKFLGLLVVIVVIGFVQINILAYCSFAHTSKVSTKLVNLNHWSLNCVNLNNYCSSKGLTRNCS